MKPYIGYQRAATPPYSGLVTESPSPSIRTVIPKPTLIQKVLSALDWLQRTRHSALFSQRPRRLRLSETVSLGEKRSVSIVEIDDVSFLIGSSANGVTLLAKLPGTPPHPFDEVLADSLEKRGTV